MIRLKATVGQKGQAVIPKPIRDQMGIRPGDEIYFRIEDDQIILDRRSDAEIWQAFFDAVPKRELPADVDWKAIYESQHEERFRRMGLDI